MSEKRIARVVENMRRAGLPQIVVTSVPSVYYLTGVWVHDVGERMLAFYLNENGDSRLFLHRMFFASLKGYENVQMFGDDDDPVDLVASQARPGLLGVDKYWPSHFTLRLMEKRPDLRIAVGSGPVDAARMRKDGEELALLRESSRLNDEALERTIRGIREGMAERELGNLYIANAEALSPEGSAFEPNTSFGAESAELHHRNTQNRLTRGSSVLLDVGLLYGRYFSDSTRTVFFGEPTDEMKRVYDAVCCANRAGREAVRPGLPMCEFDRAARRVIEEAGYGRYFLHRTGHGIGLECHESPNNSAGDRTIAEPGMVFSVEPCVSLPGKFGVRIEDLVAVTEDGCETLNHVSRELRVL